VRSSPFPPSRGRFAFGFVFGFDFEAVRADFTTFAGFALRMAFRAVLRLPLADFRPPRVAAFFLRDPTFFLAVPARRGAVPRERPPAFLRAPEAALRAGAFLAIGLFLERGSCRG
jgi:hypothetical protein